MKIIASILIVLAILGGLVLLGWSFLSLPAANATTGADIIVGQYMYTKAIYLACMAIAAFAFAAVCIVSGIRDEISRLEVTQDLDSDDTE